MESGAALNASDAEEVTPVEEIAKAETLKKTVEMKENETREVGREVTVRGHDAGEGRASIGSGIEMEGREAAEEEEEARGATMNGHEVVVHALDRRVAAPGTRSSAKSPLRRKTAERKARREALRSAAAGPSRTSAPWSHAPAENELAMVAVDRPYDCSKGSTSGVSIGDRHDVTYPHKWNMNISEIRQCYFNCASKYSGQGFAGKFMTGEGRCYCYGEDATFKPLGNFDVCAAATGNSTHADVHEESSTPLGTPIGAPAAAVAGASHVDDAFNSVAVLDLAATNPTLKAFKGGFTDGTYGYVVPNNGGKAARFDLAGFASVALLDLQATDNWLWGFVGGFTDGTYGYAVPLYNTGYFGKVARFDLAGFASVAVLDLTATNIYLKGFIGGFADGTYGYVIPLNNGAWFGKVARFDLAGFASVAYLNLAATDNDLKGFAGGFTDGTYGYAVPEMGAAGGRSGKVARFDLAFFASVALLDLTATDNDLKGFAGGFTDGTYGYVVPNNNGAWFGKVARFDLAGFASVAYLNLAATDNDLKGFVGGFTDGTYGYAVPEMGAAGGRSGKAARFDLAGFASVALLDLASTDPDLKGFNRGFTDGTYGYVVLDSNGAFFGKVARFGVYTTTTTLTLTTTTWRTFTASWFR